MAGYWDEITGNWIELGEGEAGWDYTDPQGSGYTFGSMDDWTFNNNVWIDPEGQIYDMRYLEQSGDPNILSKLVNAFKTKDGKPDWAKIATAGAGLYTMFGDKGGEGGYNKPVPKMEAVRQQIQYDDTNRVPGSTGRQYFTDTQFVPQGDTAARDAAVAASTQQAQGIKAMAPSYQEQPNPWAGKMSLTTLKPAVAPPPAAVDATMPPDVPPPTGFAAGGIAGLQKDGRYLGGQTDGMADEIPSTIDGEQPAALSHGEFVIPADVVSHLGNGNSEAGAKKLYEMMDRIRMARTGTTEQGKEINPEEFMMGGLAQFASGGRVQKFSNGGTPDATTPAGGGVPLDTSRTSTLSPWVGDYVTTALGQGAAVAAQPYQAYTGPLTAGPSGLQQQAFAGASEMAQQGYTPTQFTTGAFTGQAVGQYMNPYLQQALDPQLAEMRRQADIQRTQDAARLTKAGAYGGSRQAIMESEGARNLLDMQRKALGEGYMTAYDKAMAQFNTQQGREMEAQKATEASRQFGGEFGLKSLGQLADFGATQRAITGEGLAADKAQFEEQRDWAYKMPQYQLNLLQGLPIGAQTTSADMSGLSGLQSNIAGLASIYKTLSNLGQTPTK